jgi:exodeoxyribonuclease VII small subunit
VTDEPGTPVSELSYTEASQELDRIVAYFEQRDVDVDQLVARLERATAIVDELDRRLRRTRSQVDELVPRLEAAAGLAPVPDGDEDGATEVDEWGEIVEPDEEPDDDFDGSLDSDGLPGDGLPGDGLPGDGLPGDGVDEPAGLF